MKTIQFSIYRYNPEKDEKPSMQSYSLEVETTKGMKVLKALERLKAQDDSLSFRHSCGEGVCGSDGMNINGQNGLACLMDVDGLKQPIEIRPLPGQPVIRDLIVDMKPFFNQYESVQPWLINEKPVPEIERLQSPEEREKLDGLFECILCGCCSAACPSYWWNPDKFLGPAALLQAARFIEDSRDDATAQRLNQLDDAYKLFRCHSIMNCSQSCPKDLQPAEAISEIKRKLVERTT